MLVLISKMQIILGLLFLVMQLVSFYLVRSNRINYYTG